MSRTCFISPSKGWSGWSSAALSTGTANTSSFYPIFELKDDEIIITLNGTLSFTGLVHEEPCMYNIDSQDVFPKFFFGNNVYFFSTFTFAFGMQFTFHIWNKSDGSGRYWFSFIIIPLDPTSIASSLSFKNIALVLKLSK